MKERATLAPEKLAELQEKRTKTALEHWKVEDGVIHCDGKGGVASQRQGLRQLRVVLDWKIEKNGDSGIYLRGQPQVQIWDSENAPGARGVDKNPAPAACGTTRPKAIKGKIKSAEESRQAGRRVEHVPHHHDRRRSDGETQRRAGRRQGAAAELLGEGQAAAGSRARSNSSSTATRSGSRTSTSRNCRSSGHQGIRMLAGSIHSRSIQAGWRWS